MSSSRVIIGKVEHPLLRNLINKLSGSSKIVAIDWSETEQNLTSVSAYRRFSLKKPMERIWFSFWLVIFLVRRGHCTLDIHFVRKEILLFMLLRRMFGIQRKGRLDLVFWGTDARSLGSLMYLVRVLLRRGDTVSCTSRGMSGYLQPFFKRRIEIKYFPSPNENVLKSVPFQERKTVERLVIGNNGRSVQRHFDVLSAFSELDIRTEIKFVLFPMTYMVEIDQGALIREAKDVFPNADIRVVNDKLTEKDFADIFNCDVYVNFQKYDAFSTFLLECLGAGLTCIVDNQVEYQELEQINHLVYYGRQPVLSVLLDGSAMAKKDDVNFVRQNFIYSENMLGKWV